MTTKTHAWGNLCHLNDVLCWERYGYWCENSTFPEWASDELTYAKEVAKIARHADVRYEVVITETGNFGKYSFDTPMGVKGVFRVWDEANLWVEPWEVEFLHSTEASARYHYASEYANHKRLHDGVIDALLHYAQTGEATLPTWASAGQRYWEHSSYNRFKRAFLHEKTA